MDKEVFFDPGEVIISKTDLKGRITYANRSFCNIAGYELKELMGQPHNLIRHEDMPRAVFKLLWDTLGTGNEVFAYVKNNTKSGGFYWVFAHVTPTFAPDGSVIGYHSSRRCPNRELITSTIEPLYKQLVSIEQKPANRKEGLEASSEHLSSVVSDHARTYAEFIFKLTDAAA